MKRAALLGLVALVGCTAGGAMHDVKPPVPAGTGMRVPAEYRRIDLGSLEWRDGRAEVRVRVAGSAGLQLRLEAVGDWPAASTVRALDGGGAPLHGDRWRPARLREWSSPFAPSDVLILEIDNYPGDDAALAVVAVTTRTEP